MFVEAGLLFSHLFDTLQIDESFIPTYMQRIMSTVQIDDVQYAAISVPGLLQLVTMPLFGFYFASLVARDPGAYRNALELFNNSVAQVAAVFQVNRDRLLNSAIQVILDKIPISYIGIKNMFRLTGDLNEVQFNDFFSKILVQMLRIDQSHPVDDIRVLEWARTFHRYSEQDINLVTKYLKTFKQTFWALIREKRAIPKELYAMIANKANLSPSDWKKKYKDYRQYVTRGETRFKDDIASRRSKINKQSTGPKGRPTSKSPIPGGRATGRSRVPGLDPNPPPVLS